MVPLALVISKCSLMKLVKVRAENDSLMIMLCWKGPSSCSDETDGETKMKVVLAGLFFFPPFLSSPFSLFFVVRCVPYLPNSFVGEAVLFKF